MRLVPHQDQIIQMIDQYGVDRKFATQALRRGNVRLYSVCFTCYDTFSNAIEYASKNGMKRGRDWYHVPRPMYTLESRPVTIVVINESIATMMKMYSNL